MVLITIVFMGFIYQQTSLGGPTLWILMSSSTTWRPSETGVVRHGHARGDATSWRRGHGRLQRVLPTGANADGCAALLGSAHFHLDGPWS